jgi:uncharacterized membrane protein
MPDADSGSGTKLLGRGTKIVELKFALRRSRNESVEAIPQETPLFHSATPVGRLIRPFENFALRLYNLGRNFLPDATSNPAPAPKPRRWNNMAAGLLVLALALVVIYTTRSAFFSPLALVVVAAIGFAALLLQLRLRKDQRNPVRAPLWLNVLGLVFAIAAVFADVLHLSAAVLLIAALGAVVCFAISSVSVLHALRKKKV